MKFGVKTYDDEDFLDYFTSKADFFEVQAIRGNDYSFLKKYVGKISIVIHAEHQGFGVNPADSLLEDFNLEAIRFAQKLADEVGSKKIIIHPGFLENNSKNCSIDNAIRFFKELNDKRVCVENLPFYAAIKRLRIDRAYLCSTPDRIADFLEKTGCKFCFDINHAIEAAMILNEDVWSFVQDFEKLNPEHYHLGGENMAKGISHLSFKDSTLDLKKVFDIIPNESEITLEVGLDSLQVEEDLNHIRGVVSSK